MVTKGIIINVLGLGSTLLGIQALVGVLVAKTLSNASANPFIASAAGVFNPVLALDVFLVQAATNTLLGHFLSLVCSLWLLNVVGEGKGLRFQVRRAAGVSHCCGRRGCPWEGRLVEGRNVAAQRAQLLSHAHMLSSLVGISTRERLVSMKKTTKCMHAQLLAQLWRRSLGPIGRSGSPHAPLASDFISFR
jgi:hypothetical protein